MSLWRQAIEDYAPDDVVVMLVGCKTDLIPTNREVYQKNRTDVANMMKVNLWKKFTTAYFECSSKTGRNVEILYKSAVQAVMEHRNPLLKTQHRPIQLHHHVNRNRHTQTSCCMFGQNTAHGSAPNDHAPMTPIDDHDSTRMQNKLQKQRKLRELRNESTAKMRRKQCVETAQLITKAHKHKKNDVSLRTAQADAKADLKTKLAQKDAQIESLNDRVNADAKRLTEICDEKTKLMDELAQKNALIESLIVDRVHETQETQAKEDEIKRLQSTLEQKDAQIESLKMEKELMTKHRQQRYAMDKSKSQLQHFKTSITEIRFSDNDSKDIDKKINVLKQQIRSQQDSIVRLKEALLRAKNANKYAGATIQLGTENQSVEDKYATSIQQHIRDFIDETEDDAMGCHGDAWLDQIVDDVIKKYDVLEFRTSPIGAKRNIYIDKQFTKSWMNYVLPRFADEAMMYYWLDYTTAMQMCQGYSKQYVNKETRKFVVAIINYELRDSANNVLYGIVLCDDDKIEKKNDKYPYKLKTLMSKQQIAMEYGINSYDLPRKSRKNQEFIDKLLLKRRIVKQDLATISWSNLKLFKSQSTNNDPINKSVTITQKVMKEYCSIALERLNTHTSHKDLIPIVVIDKHNNYYGIEWVLIVHIIHRNCDVGISFRYDAKPNSFAATAIYLDKGEIESKHKLIGLKYDYCKHLRPFSLRKFKFKSDRHSIIDDDDDIAIHNGHRATTEFQQLQQKLASYQKAYQNEHGKVQQMHQQLRNTHNAYLSLKNQQYLFTAQQQQVPPAQYQNYVPQAHAHAAYNQYNNHSIIDNNMY
eukprot:238292_1